MDTKEKKELRIANHLRNQWGINNINEGEKYKKKNDGVKYVGSRQHLYDSPPSEKKNFAEKQIKHKADKIVDKHYQQNKKKSPFTQVAENAVKQLSVTMKDGHLENNAGTNRVDTVKEAIEINQALDKNFQDHKEDDYIKLIESNRLAESETPGTTWNRLDKQEKQRQKDHLNKLEHHGIENSQVKHKDFPKNKPLPLNRYKKFREKQEKIVADKKFDEEFEKEYGDKAIEQDIRGKEMRNRRAGKRPYENFSSSEMIVAEHAKDKAKKMLKVLNNPIKRNKDVEDISNKITFIQNTRKQIEEESARLKREYDEVMNRPIDEDTYKGLGSFDPRIKK